MRELIFWMNEKIFGNNKNQFMLGKLNFCLILKFEVEDRVRNQMEELEMEIIWPLQQKWNKYLYNFDFTFKGKIIYFLHRRQISVKIYIVVLHFLEGKKYSLVNYFLWQFYSKEKTSKVMVIYFTGFLRRN